jgi:signal peptidase complex subunit 1
MDYEGQKLAELIFYWIILSFGGIGWVIGFMRQDFTVVFQAWLVGVVLSVIVSSALMRGMDDCTAKWSKRFTRGSPCTRSEEIEGPCTRRQICSEKLAGRNFANAVVIDLYCFCSFVSQIGLSTIGIRSNG